MLCWACTSWAAVCFLVPYVCFARATVKFHSVLFAFDILHVHSLLLCCLCCADVACCLCCADDFCRLPHLTTIRIRLDEGCRDCDLDPVLAQLQMHAAGLRSLSLQLSTGWAENPVVWVSLGKLASLTKLHMAFGDMVRGDKDRHAGLILQQARALTTTFDILLWLRVSRLLAGYQLCPQQDNSKHWSSRPSFLQHAVT